VLKHYYLYEYVIHFDVTGCPLCTESNASANPGLKSCNFCELVLKGQGDHKKRGVGWKEFGQNR